MTSSTPNTFTINESDWERAKRVYTAALDLPSERRADFLDRECERFPDVRADVESLLAAPALQMLTACGAFAFWGGDNHTGTAEKVGDFVGPYELLRVIGDGGFGTVFLAAQTTPVHRRVALKVIKQGMDTRKVIARFEAERQVLAIMEHPNIAKVLDAGATATGRPYFVMELVRGDPITVFCDNHNLCIVDRLILFEQVCHAVQHAHSKGIIHRDLKPTNILVAAQDGNRFAKVIDFGVAKATNHHLTERTLFTEHGAIVGTPEYMSPEQADGNLDIDTRTDVYALGVLLYELLTGSTPFDTKSLRAAGYAEIQRIIREAYPPKPSSRLGQSITPIDTVASRRQSDPQKLVAQIRSELDWIVMKGLEKDRARRYDTASNLAADVRRYLNGEPVTAAPPSKTYRVMKFARRNQVAASSACLVVLTLCLATGVSGWFAVRESRQRAEAIKQASIADANAIKAQQQQALAESLADRENDALRKAIILDFYVRKVFSTQPSTIDALNVDDGSPRSELHAMSVGVTNLACWYSLFGELSTVESLHTRALYLNEKAFGPVDASVAVCLNNLGLFYCNTGQFRRAVPLLLRALAIDESVYGKQSVDVALDLNALSCAQSALGNISDARDGFDRALAILRQHAPAGSRWLAQTLWCSGRSRINMEPAAALRDFEEAASIAERILPAEHPLLRDYRATLASCRIAVARPPALQSPVATRAEGPPESDPNSETHPTVTITPEYTSHR